MPLSIGDPAPQFSLPDTDGVEHAVAGDGEATVVVFTCNHCPYALAWHDRILQAARDYSDRDVRFEALGGKFPRPARRQQVGTQRMQVLQPAALAVSVAAEQALRAERERLEDHWHQRLERARYNAQRAARQYEAVEPDHRLGARELERRWEEALGHEQHLQEEYARFRRACPPALTSREREAILRLAHDIPALWRAPETTPP